MSDWIIKCRIVRNGVDAFIKARTAEEAIAKFEKMKWDDLDDTVAEISDWVRTGEPELNA